MSNRKLILPLLFCLSTITLLAVFRKGESPSPIVFTKQELSNTNGDDLKIFLWNNYTKLIITSSDKIISVDTFHVLEKNVAKTLYLRPTLKKEGTILILKIPPNYCQECIEELMSMLKKSRYYPNKALIFTEDSISHRVIMNYDSKVRAYFFIENNFFLPIENYKYPFFFIINEEARVSKIFIPIPKDTLSIKEYLMEI